jgi:hypothetical protein
MTNEGKGAVIISVIIVISFAIVSAAVLFQPVDGAIANVLLTIHSGGFVQVMNYWLGSSSGSKAKDAHIANLTSPPKQGDA